jgi:hypothetical protein
MSRATKQMDVSSKRWYSTMVLESWDLFQAGNLSLEGMRILADGLDKLHVYEEMQIVNDRIAELEDDPDNGKLQDNEDAFYAKQEAEQSLSDDEDEAYAKELAEEDHDDTLDELDV